MCDGERCLSLPDILCKITVLEDGKEDWLELRKRRALMLPICQKFVTGTIENPRKSRNVAEGKGAREGEGGGRKRETWNVLAAIGDFSETRIFREISEKCSVQAEHLCDVCTICIH